MGTSVKMLEQHYSHFTVSDNPNKFAGHDKRDEQKRKRQQDEREFCGAVNLTVSSIKEDKQWI